MLQKLSLKTQILAKQKLGITIPATIDTIVKADVIGYTPRFTPIDRVILTYKWKSVAWKGTSNNKFKIEVTIAKTGIPTDSKIITVIAKPGS